MQEFPSALFLAENLRDSQGALSRGPLTAYTHLVLALDRDRESQIAAYGGADVFNLQLRSAVFVLRRCPIVARPHLRPALFKPAEAAKYRSVLALRSILLPQRRIAGKES